MVLGKRTDGEEWENGLGAPTGLSRDSEKWRRFFSFPLVAMVVAILFYVGAVALGILLGSLLPNLGGREVRSIVKDAIILAMVLGSYKLLIAPLGEKPRDDLQVAGSLAGLGRGILAGLAIFSCVVGIAFAFGIYRIVGVGRGSAMLVPLVSVALLPAFTEELLFRGILFRWIEEFAGSWVALAVTSVLFGLAHIFNPGATWFSSFAIAVEAGLLLGGAYMLTRSLWMPVGLHAAWNFAEGPIFGVPVSGGPSAGLIHASISGPQLVTGGSFGLEASVIAVAVATTAGIAFVVVAARRGELITSSWTRRRSS